MRLLIVAPYLPWPLDHGGKIRSFHLVRERAKRHEVTLVCLSGERQPDMGPLRTICREVRIVPDRGLKVVPLAGLLVGAGAFSTLRFRSREMAHIVRELSAGSEFDELQIEMMLVWQYAAWARAPFKLLSTQNLEANVTSELSRAAPGPIERLLYRLETKRLAVLERDAWESCDACAAVSEADRSEIARSVARPSSVFTVPNGVDPGHFDFASDLSRRVRSVLLFGSLDYRPNLDAALWFLRSVVPRLRERLPDVRIVLAGRGTTDLSGEVRGEPVDLLGGVPDVRALYASAGAMAVPLRAGGGSRIKVLEAMASGLPIVASRKAVEGLDVEDGAHFLLASDPDEYVRKLEIALGGGERVARQCAAARELVIRNYGWDRIVDRMESDLATIRGSGR